MFDDHEGMNELGRCFPWLVLLSVWWECRFQPPVTMVRAVKEAAAGLKQAGHEVVDVTGQLPMNGWEVRDHPG